ncbi:hypothetical protein H2O73_16515 [Vibrio sp. 404]|uniref:Uncharacterized protein n=1 Tax=Vibrio marinisediminis TaxID=2758441 RepID=A0A7W2FTP6_9VIBR|nr:hypothetical protein [Vibrio marinisediminis]MBA5763969.1 hypothetical protein [Vibrio marinisediminis]
MNYNSAINHRQPQTNPSVLVTHLDLIKSQLNQLTPHQLSELRGAIDAKLEPKTTTIISDEESAFLRSLF